MLTSRITPHNIGTDPEDIFSSALTTIFPDDTINSHGDPGSYVTYRSPLLGDIRLQIPQHPDEEQGRRLFAHHLWNAGVVIAEAIERASHSELNGKSLEGQVGAEENPLWKPKWWDVRGKSVLELGAGTALPSIISARLGASSVTMTDHPTSPALTTNAIEQNVKANVRPDQALSLTSPVSVYGYTWGTSTFYSPSSYGKSITPPTTSYDRIIIADCLWMPSQHINLIKTILTFLPVRRCDGQTSTSSGNPVESEPCALVCAGFHTGRPIVASFFSLATEPPEQEATRPMDPPWQPHSLDSAKVDEELDTTSGAAASVSSSDEGLSEEELSFVGKLKLAEIFEVDVDLNTRPWEAAREGETRWEAKRWCVVGVLVIR